MAKRGRKRKEVTAKTDGSLPLQVQQLHAFQPSPLQENPAPPANPRYPTQRFNAVLNQSASSTSPLRYSLRSLVGNPKHLSIGARRVLLDISDAPFTESGYIQALEKCISELPHQNQVMRR